MGKLTTHVLDTMNGCPAAGMAVTLYRIDGTAPVMLKQLTLNDDGRADQPLLADAALQPGRYRLVFGVPPTSAAAAWRCPSRAFLDEVPLDFGIADASLHYHVPLLVRPGATPPTAAAEAGPAQTLASMRHPSPTHQESPCASLPHPLGTGCARCASSPRRQPRPPSRKSRSASS